MDSFIDRTKEDYKARARSGQLPAARPREQDTLLAAANCVRAVAGLGRQERQLAVRVLLESLEITDPGFAEQVLLANPRLLARLDLSRPAVPPAPAGAAEAKTDMGGTGGAGGAGGAGV